MIPPIAPVSALSGVSPASASPATATSSALQTNDFDNVLGSALDDLNQTTSNSESLALEGATGQANVADVTVAATEAQLAVQLASTVRDDGVSALNSIMSLQAG